MTIPDRLFSRTFRAMGTEVKVLLCGRRRDAAAEAFDHVARLFERCEHRLSRFRPDSELSALNRSQGREFEASAVLFSAVRAAVRAAEETDGVFDPTLIDALERFGYDRPFEQIKPPAGPIVATPAAGRYRGIRLEPDRRSIMLPEGVRIDLGGIGKGWMVDEAQRVLAPFGNALIDAGGDIAALGDAPGYRGWVVGVEHPLRPSEDVAVICLRNRAVATSSVMRRRWAGSTGVFHHLIDPRSGAPTTSDVVAATVVAPRAREADVAAKVALILGAEEGQRYIERHPDTAAILVRASGEVIRSGQFERYEEVVGSARPTGTTHLPALD